MYDFESPPKPLQPGSNVWAYMRDSGGDSQETSVQQQKDAIEAYCKQFGLVLVKTFADIAKSGKDTEGRDQFRAMMRHCQDDDQRPKAILVWNYARYARNMRQAMINSFQLEEFGVILVSITEKYNENDDWGWIEMIFRHKSNEDARKKISEDTKRGLLTVFTRGGSFGNPPRGFLAETIKLGVKRDGSARKVTHWVPDPDLWALVQLAWQLRAEGKTYTEIQSATGQRLYRSKNCWPTFFRNKAYLGVGVFGELEVPDHHPAAIDRQTWDKVQELINGSPKVGKPGHPHHPRRIGSPSLLAGLAFCKYCGAALVHHRTKSATSDFHYYTCGTKDRQGAEACIARLTSGVQLERAVFNTVVNRILTLDFFYDLLAEIRVHYADHTTLDEQIKAVHENLRHTRRSIGNLLELVESFGVQSALGNLKKREAEKLELESTLQDLEAKRALADIDITPDVLTLVINSWRSQLESARQSNDLLSIKNFLLQFVTRVEVSYKQVEIYYTYPINDLAPMNISRLDFSGMGAHSKQPH